MKRMNPKQKRSRDAAFYLLLLVILICAIYMLTSTEKPADKLTFSEVMVTTSDKLTFSEVVTMFEEEKVEAFVVEGNVLTMDIRGITLEQAGDMVALLEESPLVAGVTLHSAVADTADEARIFLSILLTKEGI